MGRNSEDPVQRFLYWWPVIARVVGLIGAFAEGGYAVVTHQGADAGILAFCGTLVIAPAVFNSQGERNRKRRLYEETDDGEVEEGKVVP